jgi:hypothetical protein
MRLEPTIVNHPKFIALKSAIGDYAMEALVRMFGHCQEDQRGEFWPGKSPEYLEIVTRWSGEPLVLWNALTMIGWASQEDGGIRIHQWNDYNSVTVNAWTKWKNRRNAKQSPSADHHQTITRPSADHHQPNSSQSGLNTSADHASLLSLPSGEIGESKKKKGGGVDGAAVKASIAQFAALKSVLATHPGRPGSDPPPTSEERADYRKKRAVFEELQKKQARGDFE